MRFAHLALPPAAPWPPPQVRTPLLGPGGQAVAVVAPPAGLAQCGQPPPAHSACDHEQNSASAPSSGQ